MNHQSEIARIAAEQRHDPAEVTQEDRDAAAEIHLQYNPNSKQVQREAERMRSGKFDHDPLVQAFARHRQASEARRNDKLQSEEARELVAELNALPRNVRIDEHRFAFTLPNGLRLRAIAALASVVELLGEKP
ncbi:MAG: hypothetical protein V4657_09425 [Pseudomonadota bacterium]